jgi:diguanylate cyclase (GGDEF)-like protein
VGEHGTQDDADQQAGVVLEQQRQHGPRGPAGGDADDGAVSLLERAAVDARMAGDFTRAAELFAQASGVEPDLAVSLHLRMRGAMCLAIIDESAAALDIAESVANQARSEEILAELADALGLIADQLLGDNRFAEAAEALAEATYALERLPNDPEMYQVVHNIACSYARSGFTSAALELYDRSLRLADNDPDRQFSYSSMAVAYHYAALHEHDEGIRQRHVHDGLYSATAALDPEGGAEVMAICTAQSHRSLMLSQIGHFRGALQDAEASRRTATELGMREEQVIAMAGEAVARWQLDRDPTVLELIAATKALAGEINYEDYLGSMLEVEVELLWSLDRFDDARSAMQRNLLSMSQRLHRESAARWEHVRLGVEHLRVEAISQSDPLTGLPNRRYLASWLPDVLEHHRPVCLGVIDLDGFKAINDNFSYGQGDRVLQQVALLLERVCRRGDSAVRLGGDEFVMVLRETSPGDARAVFGRILQLVAERCWDGLPADVRITASVGVAVAGGQYDCTQVLTAANEALRNAKVAGRDRMFFAP